MKNRSCLSLAGFWRSPPPSSETRPKGDWKARWLSLPTQINMKAYVYACFDPKVWPLLVEIFDARFGRHNYFFDLDPGAVKNLVSPFDPHAPKIVISKIKAAFALHPFKTLALVNHSKCGAYKLAGKEFNDGEKEEGFHKQELEDRKSTRLNSSHMSISYAVFC